MRGFSLYQKFFLQNLPPQVRSAIFGIIAVAFTILCLDGWRSINTYYSTLRESSENLESLAQVVAAQTETSFDLIDALLASQVATLESGPLDPQAQDRMRQSLITAAGRLQPNLGLIVVDEKGNSINSSVDSMQKTKINYADREYFTYHQTHANTLLYIGKPILRKSTKEWAITLSRRWNKPDGTFGGSITASVNLTYFQAYFKNLQIGNNGALSIYLDRGLLIARRSPKQSPYGEDAARSKEFLAHFSKAPAGSFTDKSYFDGQERLHSYHHLNKYPVLVAASYGLNDILMPLKKDFLRHVIISIALICILTLLGVRLVRQMQQRITDVLALQEGQIKVEKLNEELHLRTQQAEAASLSKSQFLANMSHEIRTPMNAILGMQQLMGHTQLSEKQKDYLNKVQIATTALLSIINDILDFSKVEAGKMTLESQPFRFDHLLRDLAVILSASVGDKQIEILFDIDPTLPKHVLGDALRLRQILLNLTGNAIKFTSRGEVVVRVRRVACDSNSEDEPNTSHIEFEVKDSGIGIESDQLENIFTGFSQAETSTTRRFGGTGLGLAISRRLVQLHGSQLYVESTPGKGSRFRFVIKFKSLNAEENLPAQWQLKKLRTLVVDDNQLARETLANMANSLGWSVDSVASGSEALQHLRECTVEGKPYDLILMDWMMPEMDGWETANHIRQQFLHRDIPIIVMVTAHAHALLEDRCKQTPTTLDGFLFKPVTTTTLLDLLEHCNNDTASNTASGARPGASSVSPSHLVRSLGLNDLHILLVEDNLLNQQVAIELLGSEGAKVSLAENGQIALEMLVSANTPFDVVLMDIQMPIMDGYTATRRIRQIGHLQDQVIIAMTANVLKSDHAACMAAGMNDHVGKPFVLTELVGVIRRHLKHPPLKVPASTNTTHASRALANGTPKLPLPDAMQALAVTHGIDLTSALADLNHNLPLLRTTLKIFVHDALQASVQLPAMLAKQSVHDLLHLLHTLKSAAAIVGIKPLSLQVSVVEAKLREHKTISLISDEILRLAQEFAQKSDIIAGIVNAWTELADNKHHADEPDTSALLSLIDLLEASNMSALDQHQHLHPMLVKLSPTLAQALETAINHFDFLGATHLCRQLLALPSDTNMEAEAGADDA